jgi:hypothetical protein
VIKRRLGMLKVTGSSDDIVEFEGDLSDELYPGNNDENYLAFSDGTVLFVEYDDDGIWRFKTIYKGSLFDKKEEGSRTNDENDTVYFLDGIKWVLLGNQIVK